MIRKALAIYNAVNIAATIGILVHLIANCTRPVILLTVALAITKELVTGSLFVLLKTWTTDQSTSFYRSGLIGGIGHGLGQSWTHEVGTFVLCGPIAGVFGFYAISVLYGAPLTESFDKTLYFSCLMSCLITLPLGVLMFNRYGHILEMLLQKRPEDPLEWCALYIVLGTLLGAWFGAFPIPLDWDRPWQEWPITCCIGALAGHTLGHMTCLVNSIRHHQAHRTKKKHFN